MQPTQNESHRDIPAASSRDAAAAGATSGAGPAFRIALVQLAVVDGEMDENVARATALIRQAPAADLYLLPELFTTGYAHATWAEAASRHTPEAIVALQQLAIARGGWIGGSMIAETASGGLANRFHLLAPTVGNAPLDPPSTYDKVHLFPPMGEPERLTAGAERVVRRIGRGEAAIDMALSVCFDLRFPEQYRFDAVAGATLFACVAEWPHPRSETLRLLARARAAENQAWLALANRAGPSADGTQFCGGSCVIAPDGTVLADAGAAPDTITVATIDVAAPDRARAAFPVLPLRAPGVDYR